MVSAVGVGYVWIWSDRRGVAYATAGFLMGAVTALILTWRFPDSVGDKSASSAIPLGAVVGVVLILTSLNAPTLESGVMGTLSGLIFGIAISPFWRPSN